MTAEDADVYRDIRLESLRNAPTSFGALLDEEAARDRRAFAARLTETNMFGAFSDTTLTGTAGYERLSGKAAHAGWVIGVYVQPGARGTGVGRALIAALLDAAKADGLLCLRLAVNATNTPAMALYRGAGFRYYGTEHAALLHDGHYHDEHLMELFLRSPGPAAPDG